MKSKGLIEIKGKHKEEKTKSKIWLKFIIAIIIAFIIVMVGYLIIEKTKNTPENNSVMEQSYQIQNVGNVSFENTNISVENNISHIEFDLVNGENKKIPSQEIEITVKKDEKNISYKYVIPDIEQGDSYNIKLKTTGDLTNAQEIKVEKIEL